MKRILFALLSAVCMYANAATLVPIQLLNPAGSTSGQAIVSTGASTAPAWSAINAATLNGATFASPPAAGYGSTTPEPVAATTISATGLITPASAIGIKGTTTNDSPAAGSIGEPATNSTTGTAMTINTPANCTTLPLTAGNWLVWGMVTFTPNPATTVAQIVAAISTTSATLPTLGTYQALGLSFTTGANQSLTAMPLNIKLASSGTVYLVGQSSFSANTMTCTGFIYALRIR